MCQDCSLLILSHLILPTSCEVDTTIVYIFANEDLEGLVYAWEHNSIEVRSL